jgi:phosphoribosylaminoimidazole-succinocarboxamide synthase
MTDEWVETISKRYIELYEKVTGTLFTPQHLEEEENFKIISAALSKYQ